MTLSIGWTILGQVLCGGSVCSAIWLLTGSKWVTLWTVPLKFHIVVYSAHLYQLLI